MLREIIALLICSVCGCLRAKILYEYLVLKFINSCFRFVQVSFLLLNSSGVQAVLSLGQLQLLVVLIELNAFPFEEILFQLIDLVLPALVVCFQSVEILSQFLIVLSQRFISSAQSLLIYFGLAAVAKHSDECILDFQHELKLELLLKMDAFRRVGT